MAIEEDVHSMLVGEGLHGHAHLLKLLVAGISGVPAEEQGELTSLSQPTGQSHCGV